MVSSSLVSTWQLSLPCQLEICTCFSSACRHFFHTIGHQIDVAHVANARDIVHGRDLGGQCQFNTFTAGLLSTSAAKRTGSPAVFTLWIHSEWNRVCVLM